MNIDVDWTKPIRMRDGRAVRAICHDRDFTFDPRFKHVILIMDEAQGELLATCMDDGRLFDVPANNNLFNLIVENWEGLQ